MIWALSAVCWAAEVRVTVRQRDDGDPVVGATVSDPSNEGVADPAVTDRRGRVTVDLPDDVSTVTVEAPGFAPAEGSIEEGRARVWLDRVPGDFEIVVEGLKPTSHATRHVVDGEQAMETPGTLDDAIRLVQSLPGVTVQREYSPTSGDLSVRGSSPGDSRYYLDGIEIPYLYHFNQYASVFPASQIDTLELFPSTFSSQYGDAVGGVVEARSKLTPPHSVHGSAHINFVMAGGDVRAPLSKRWWVSASGRRSYQDLAGEQTAQFTVWPTFHDFVVRAEHVEPNGGTGIFAFGAGDAYTRAVGELDLLDPVEADRTPSLAYAQNYEGVGVRHDWSGSGASGGRVVAAFVHHRRRGALQPTTGSEDLETQSLRTRFDASHDPETWFQLDGGWEGLLDFTTLTVTPAAGDDGIRVSEESPALARGLAVDDRLVRARGGLYGTAHLAAGPVRFMPGLRLSADTTAPELRPDPRLAVRWRAGEQTVLKLSGGRYTQRPATELQFEAISPQALPTTSSWQAGAGWEQTVSNRLELGLESYVKEASDPVFVPIDGPPEAFERGRAGGVELLTRYRMRDLFFLSGWVAVQRTLLTDPQGEVQPADGDQLLSGGIVASWDIGQTNLGFRYRLASGLPFTPIDGSIYDGASDRWIPVPGTANSDRLPTYHKVDARVAHELQFRGWDLTLSAEVWIVPRSSSQLYPIWNFDYREQDWVLGPTLLPLLGARARF